MVNKCSPLYLIFKNPGEKVHRCESFNSLVGIFSTSAQCHTGNLRNFLEVITKNRSSYLIYLYTVRKPCKGDYSVIKKNKVQKGRSQIQSASFCRFCHTAICLFCVFASLFWSSHAWKGKAGKNHLVILNSSAATDSDFELYPAASPISSFRCHFYSNLIHDRLPLGLKLEVF